MDAPQAESCHQARAAHGGEQGWINDPNGLVYYKGEWHLFANGAGSYWVHAVSRLTALGRTASKTNPRQRSRKYCFRQRGRGWNNTSGFGTAKEKALLAFFTGWKNKVQCMAYNIDRGRTWTKYKENPILARADRDESLWYEPDLQWILIVWASGRSYNFFGSADLKNWRN